MARDGAVDTLVGGGERGNSPDGGGEGTKRGPMSTFSTDTEA